MGRKKEIEEPTDDDLCHLRVSPEIHETIKRMALDEKTTMKKLTASLIRLGIKEHKRNKNSKQHQAHI